jgi:hypothetical protein
MKNTFFILLLSILLSNCTQDSPYSVDLQAEAENLTSLDAEIASLINSTHAETGLMSMVYEQIRVQKLTDASLTPEELLAHLEIPEKELSHFSEKISSFQTFVEQSGYSKEQVSASAKMQLTDRITVPTRGTPCYNTHELEVLTATIIMVDGPAAGSATVIAPLACALGYVATVGVSRIKYQNCVNSRTGG